jgi:hypothetical protein
MVTGSAGKPQMSDPPRFGGPAAPVELDVGVVPEFEQAARNKANAPRPLAFNMLRRLTSRPEMPSPSSSVTPIAHLIASELIGLAAYSDEPGDIGAPVRKPWLINARYSEYATSLPYDSSG